LRTVRGTVILTGLLILVAPAAASAEWQFAPFLGYTFKASTTLVDFEQGVTTTHWNFGGTATLLGGGPLGIEALFIHTPGFFERDESDLAAINLPATITESHTSALMGNVVVTIMRRWNRYGLRPYLSGGAGLMHVRSLDLQGLVPIRLNLLGMNAGGGGVGMVTDRIGLRFDLRYFRSIQGVDPVELEVPITLLGNPVRLRYWTTTFGVVIKY
jgi:hypothetical protein